jgi:hypothetical protein
MMKEIGFAMCYVFFSENKLQFWIMQKKLMVFFCRKNENFIYAVV